MLGLHTLDARDNALIEWIFAGFAKGDVVAFQEAMQLEAAKIRVLLREGGINYDDLKSALIPTREGRQVVFVYDWLDHPSFNYAIAFADVYLPLLRDNLRTSVSQGDLLADDLPVRLMDCALVRPREETVEWRTQFAVYFSNLKSNDIDALHRELSSDPRYRGYIDVTEPGPIRDYLARCLPSMWVLNGRKVILTHGGDEPFVGKEDPVGFHFAANGYDVVSLIDSYFYGFLSYKIESDVAVRAEADRFLTLAAHLGAIVDVEKVPIVVPPAKLESYLLVDPNKLRLMTAIGLREVTPSQLADIIREKLLCNYVYDFRYAEDGTPLFAVSCDFVDNNGQRARRLIALKYDMTNAAISLVTMY